MWTFGKYLDAEIHPNACHPTQSNGRGFATYNSRKTIPFQRHLIQLDVLWYFFSCIGSGSVKVRTASRPAPLRLGANSNPLPKKIMSAGSSLNTSAVGCCRPYRHCPIIGLVGSCNACSSYLNFLSDMILYQKIFQNHLDRSLVQPHWTWSDGLSMSQWIYRRYILIYIYIEIMHIYICLWNSMISPSPLFQKIMSWSPAQLTAWPRGYPQLSRHGCRHRTLIATWARWMLSCSTSKESWGSIQEWIWWFDVLGYQRLVMKTHTPWQRQLVLLLMAFTENCLDVGLLQ